MQKPNLYKTFVILACFLLYRNSKYLYGLIIPGEKNLNHLSYFTFSGLMLVTGILMALLADYILNKRISAADFGVSSNGFLKGLTAAAIFSLPMFIGLGIVYDFNFQPSLEILYRGFVLAGFREEFIYRAFLFGFLFFYAGWGFLSAGIIAGLFFGAGHLYQADSPGSAVGIFLFTTGVSLGFGWFYYAWKSLWMVVFLHGFMDVIWDSFQVETNVTGSIAINIARFSSIIIAVIYSIRIARQNNRFDLKDKLWVNRTEDTLL